MDAILFGAKDWNLDVSENTSHLVSNSSFGQATGCTGNLSPLFLLPSFQGRIHIRETIFNPKDPPASVIHSIDPLCPKCFQVPECFFQDSTIVQGVSLTGNLFQSLDLPEFQLKL